LGVQIPDDALIEAAPIQGATTLYKKMEEMEKVKIQAAKQEAEDKQLMNKLVASQTDQNISLAQERRARVIADIGLARERTSEVAQNEAAALLANAKTINEMKSMGNNQLMDAVRLAMEMHQLSQAESDKTIARDEQFLDKLRKESDTSVEQEQQSAPGALQGEYQWLNTEK
jgi:hypothetical protein